MYQKTAANSSNNTPKDQDALTILSKSQKANNQNTSAKKRNIKWILVKSGEIKKRIKKERKERIKTLCQQKNVEKDFTQEEACRQYESKLKEIIYSYEPTEKSKENIQSKENTQFFWKLGNLIKNNKLLKQEEISRIHKKCNLESSSSSTICRLKKFAESCPDGVPDFYVGKSLNHVLKDLERQSSVDIQPAIEKDNLSTSSNAVSESCSLTKPHDNPLNATFNAALPFHTVQFKSSLAGVVKEDTSWMTYP